MWGTAGCFRTGFGELTIVGIIEKDGAIVWTADAYLVGNTAETAIDSWREKNSQIYACYKSPQNYFIFNNQLAQNYQCFIG